MWIHVAVHIKIGKNTGLAVFKFVFFLVSGVPPVMEEVETLLVEAEALPLVNGEGGGSPRELELIAELVKRA